MKLEPQDYESLEPIIYKSLTRYFKEHENNEFEKKIFNITQAAEQLGKSYNWVSERMKDGTLKTTSDGMYISGKEINRYLGIS